ncbi:hypothetical protein [Metabacillus sp. 84]|uniref:hypothetical protein n=1 Tax=Metabacillus sp. 84 TaxID=3404705 RepID=UPI003CED03F4
MKRPFIYLVVLIIVGLSTLLVIQYRSSTQNANRLGELQADYSTMEEHVNTLEEEVNSLTEQNEKISAELQTEQDVQKREEEAQIKEAAAKEKQKVVNFTTGNYFVGEDIFPGRYVITTDDNHGLLFISDYLGNSKEMKALGKNSMNNLTVDLQGGDEIEINGLDNVTFTPK